MILDLEKYSTAGVWTKLDCVCDYCGIKFVRSIRNLRLGRTILEKESCNSKQCARQKREESQLKKYGTRNAGGSKDSQQKAISTWQTNLGVSNPMHSEKVKNKVAQTCEAKYQVKSFLATQECRVALKEHCKNNAAEIRQKIEKTCLEKYQATHPRKNVDYFHDFQIKFLEKHGVAFPSQLSDHLEKREATCLQKYGFKHPVMNADIQQKIKTTCLERYGKYPVNSFGETENEIRDLVRCWGFKTEKNYSLLNGKEIDILIPEQNLAIEYCGLFWHNEMSPTPRDRLYHYNKYEELRKIGVQLITIFEDEWLLRKDICKSILMSKLGVIPNKIPARKCLVRQVDIKMANAFMDKNHLQGKAKSSIAFGLYYDKNLVSCITFGSHHRKSTSALILNRMSSLVNTNVIGGFSKIFNHAKQNLNKEIVTWSDNRWSTGAIYKKLGFQLNEEMGPDYSYYKYGSFGKKRKSKQSMKKKNVNCPDGTTEREWCLQNDFVRIWDCGKIRWIYKL